ncbi:YfhO family protein [Flavobacterium sp. ASW18X]|uniref:YfhO family protein n=1 Tax=Flavobacterium sp. ASW18X TaxID=2572595 RepID=UPI0010ADF4D6|nr:YfhO family protein [Flavobacterium sp. ASW18X]TKD66189.1 hypothetical protein FBT53_04765 [Flavobacterium sp. ASW18X]
MKLSTKAFFTHLAVLLFFMIAALVYFYPVIQGKGIFQSDIAQYKGMAQERNSFKENTGEESYWTNSAFGGMPTYQLGANYPHDYVKKLDRLIRFLPRPADYLFLYFIGFYILMLSLKVDYRLAILGSLAFGLSTYYIIILGVGHNAKAHAIAYLPMLLGGIVLVFRKKYVLGFIVTALAMALEISANHYQMTYYFMLLVLILGVVQLVYAIIDKKLTHFFISVGLLIVAVILGIATNATGLMATKEYADWSTRGESNLTINPDGSPKATTSGLDTDYITQYSYGITESLDLFVPRMFGGSNSEKLGKQSNTYDFLTSQGLSSSRALEFSENLPLYWGDQPIVAGPAYLGAVVLFLFFIGLILVKGKRKWWLLAGVVVALVLSWGKNFSVLTDFMIANFPMYNKFRAVSSIQVIVELCVPVLAILGLKQLFRKKVTLSQKLNAVIWSGVISLGLIVIIFFLKGTFSFESLNDGNYLRYYGEELMALIRSDREAVYVNDTLRTLLLCSLTFVLLFLYAKGKLNKNFTIVALGVLVVVDLGGVAKRYVDADDFVSMRQINRPFKATDLDKQIQQDPEIFRVFDPKEGLNGARTSFFHKSLGGYHAAKPKRIQDLFEFHLYNNNVEVLNMLNAKYIIQEDEEGRSFPAVNPDANGPAWFVQELVPVTSENEEIKALDGIDTKTTAVYNASKFKIDRNAFVKDSTAKVAIKDYRPNLITYNTNSEKDGFIVFSEMYYADGWNAYLDDNLAPHIKVNYALRGMAIPTGAHTITFKFEPGVIKKGSTIALISNILLGLIIICGLGFLLKPKRDKAVA